MINQLIKEAHENAINKGWWEEERTFGEMISLMHSELSEALEEYRKGKDVCEGYYSCQSDSIHCNGECKKCKYAKPEGIPVELADAIIRIFDLCGKYEIDLESEIENAIEYEYYDDFPGFITCCHLCLSRSFSDDINFGDGKRWLGNTYKTIENFCNESGIDLEEAIKRKMAYNKTREWKHGGKKI